MKVTKIWFDIDNICNLTQKSNSLNILQTLVL